MSDVTQILDAINRGHAGATDELLPLIYGELRLLAAQKISHEPPGHTLQATALVHEAYLRLVGTGSQGWSGRAHFFGAAAEAMRRILVENARRKRRLKRGGGQNRVELDDAVLAIDEPAEDIIALDEALNKLAEEDGEICELVKLRYFAGLTLQQTAEIMGIPRRTADRQWAYARAWLYQEIVESEGP
jgi:RNA polymerase sigma factor (TIGR02999 family)